MSKERWTTIKSNYEDRSEGIREIAITNNGTIVFFEVYEDRAVFRYYRPNGGSNVKTYQYW